MLESILKAGRTTYPHIALLRGGHVVQFTRAVQTGHGQLELFDVHVGPYRMTCMDVNASDIVAVGALEVELKEVNTQ